MERPRLNVNAAQLIDPSARDLQRRSAPRRLDGSAEAASPVRPRLIAANWKMHKTPAAAIAFIDGFRAVDPGDGGGVEMLLFPAMTSLAGGDAGRTGLAARG
jgi:hypothetical protein